MLDFVFHPLRALKSYIVVMVKVGQNCVHLHVSHHVGHLVHLHFGHHVQQHVSQEENGGGVIKDDCRQEIFIGNGNSKV